MSATFREKKKPGGRDHLGDQDVDNIKMDLKGAGYLGVDWIPLALDRIQWRAFYQLRNAPSSSTEVTVQTFNTADTKVRQ